MNAWSRSRTIAATEFAPGVGESCIGLRRTSRPPIGRGVFRAVEESAAIGIAEAFDRETHGSFGDFEIAQIERGFIGVEQRGGSENLIVERAFERGSADAVEKTFRRVPRLGEDAVERLQREFAAVGAAQDMRGFEICGDEHRVPADVERFVHGGRGPAREARGEELSFGAGEEQRDFVLAQFQFLANRFDWSRDPEDIFLWIVVHLAARANVVIKLDRRAIRPAKGLREPRRQSR